MPMNRNDVVKVATLIAMMFLSLYSEAQQFDINTQMIEPLIKEWNFANNSRSVKSFRNVYGDTVIFYTQRVSKEGAIARKVRLFREEQSFSQKISGKISYTPYTGGVIKCEFRKDVWQEFGWKSHPSYLLVSYERSRYWIVGESDYET